LIGKIFGLGPIAAFIHVNKAIDATLMLASSRGTIDNQEMCDSQKAALATVNLTDKSALERIFPGPVPRTRNKWVIKKQLCHLRWLMSQLE